MYLDLKTHLYTTKKKRQTELVQRNMKKNRKKVSKKIGSKMNECRTLNVFGFDFRGWIFRGWRTKPCYNTCVPKVIIKRANW